MARLKQLNPFRLNTLKSTERTIKPQTNSWRSNKSSTQRGYGYKWQQYRLEFLKLNPLCAYCQKDGVVTEATVVDHVVPHRGNDALFWNTKNHQALCKLCHDKVKQKEEQTG